MIKLFLAAFCVAAVSVQAQELEPTGGKAIISPQPRPDGQGKDLQPWFYVTRVNASGSEERVPLSYVFPGGSKAYLNIMPMAEGHLAVFIGDSPELKKQQLYYPQPRRDSKKADLSLDADLVRKDESIKVPVIFDDKPGTTRFTLLLIEEGKPRSQSLIATIHERRLDSGATIQTFLEGGKGVVRTREDDTPQGEPPVLWSRLSLRNQ